MKRERGQTNETPKPPLKTSRGVHGQTVYHIDSDDETDGGKARKRSEARRGPADEPQIEVVDL